MKVRLIHETATTQRDKVYTVVKYDTFTQLLYIKNVNNRLVGIQKWRFATLDNSWLFSDDLKYNLLYTGGDIFENKYCMYNKKNFIKNFK